MNDIVISKAQNNRHSVLGDNYLITRYDHIAECHCSKYSSKLTWAPFAVNLLTVIIRYFLFAA